MLALKTVERKPLKVTSEVTKPLNVASEVEVTAFMSVFSGDNGQFLIEIDSQEHPQTGLFSHSSESSRQQGFQASNIQFAWKR